MQGISVVIPAYNEDPTIGSVIKDLQKQLESSGHSHEIIVVDDGSTDKTASIAKDLKVHLISHPVSTGYGSALRDGILAAQYGSIVIIDADGTYPAGKLSDLVKPLDEYHMVVGARRGAAYRESLMKYPMRLVFGFICTFVTGTKIPDANSGFRAFRRETVMKFKDHFCLGFSFTTTLTLMFHLDGLFVKYVPVDYYKRKQKSHIRIFRDTLRALQIISQTILIYNPIKLFLMFFLIFLLLALIFLIPGAVTDHLPASLVGCTFLLSAIFFLGLGFLADSNRSHSGNTP